MLSNGIYQGLIVVIPFGGQMLPISTVGFRLEWKNAQKNAKNNIISDTINNSIPKRNPCCTNEVCAPSKVPSRTTSRHQKDAFKMVITRPKKNKVRPTVYECIKRANPNTIKNALNAVTIGQGLASTIWNGCFCSRALFK